MKRIKAGFMVIEADTNGDYEQILDIEVGESLPEGGVLKWSNSSRFIFPDRKSARACITRTEHYRLAFSDEERPEKKYCKVVQVDKHVLN